MSIYLKMIKKKVLNSIKLFLLFSIEISSTEMSITEYRDVQYRVPRCRICSVPRCPDTFDNAIMGCPIM